MCVCACECVHMRVRVCACVLVWQGEGSLAASGPRSPVRLAVLRRICPPARARMLPPPLTPLAPDPSHPSAITFWPSDACNSRGCLPSPFLTPARSSRPDYYWPSLATLLPGFSLAFFNSLPLQMDLPEVQL